MARRYFKWVGGALVLAGAALGLLEWTTKRPEAMNPVATARVPPRPPRAEPSEPAQEEPRVPAVQLGLRGLQRSYLDNPERPMQERLLDAAGWLGTREAVAWLAMVATTDERNGVRAAVALGRIDKRGSAADLASLASGSGPVILRANAARALGAAGGAPEVPLLARLVADSTEPQRVRQEAALSLARIGAAASVPALASTLNQTWSDASPQAEQLRISIIQALAGAGTVEAREALSLHAQRAPGLAEKAFLAQILAARP
jgi:hypothetical protein